MRWMPSPQLRICRAPVTLVSRQWLQPYFCVWDSLGLVMALEVSGGWVEDILGDIVFQCGIFGKYLKIFVCLMPPQAIPKFKNHYVRYFDLEQISRESVEETRGLGEGTTLRYLRASHSLRARSSSRTGTSALSATQPADASLPPAPYFAKALEQELHRVRRYVEIFSEEIWVQLGAIVDSLAKVATPRAVGETLSAENLQALTEQCNEIGKHGAVSRNGIGG